MEKQIFKIVLLTLLLCLFVACGGDDDSGSGSSDDNDGSGSFAVCDPNNLNLCIDEISCSDAGGSWFNDICNAESWHISTIDDSSHVWNISMAIDSENDIHIVYNDLITTQPSNHDLKYITNKSGIFQTVTMSTSIGPVDEMRPEIAIDFENKLHAVYLDSNTNELKYAFNSSGNWEISNVTTFSTIAQGITTDSQGLPHISYCGANSLYYSTKVGDEWQTEIIDQDLENYGFMGSKNSIAVDTNNKVHICYYDRTNSRLLYATNISGEWIISTINNNVSIFNDETSLVIDTNNQLHISYHNMPENELIYATNVTGDWVNTIIDNDSHGYSSLCMDSDNKLHISYHSSGLKYASNQSGVWITEIIDDNGYMGFHTSIAIGSNNKIHIAFHHYQTGALLYATK